MKKEIVSNRQGICLITLFVIGDAVIVARGLEAGRDLWISLILATLASIPLVWVYAKIQIGYPEKDLFEINEIILGKILGKLINVLFLVFVFVNGASIIRAFSEFFITVGLPETPQIVFGIFLTGLCGFAAKEGVEILGRLAELFLIILSFIVPMAILTLIPKMDIHHLQPVLYNGWGPVFIGTFSSITFPFGEAVTILMISMGLRKKESFKKVYILGVMLGGSILFSTAVTELLALGYNTYSSKYFPAYGAVSRINVGDFIQRLEIIVSTISLLAGFIKISVCLLAACKGVASLFNTVQYRFMVWPMALLLLNLSVIIYSDIFHAMRWAEEIWVYFAIPFEMILPILILVIIEIRNRRKDQGSCRHE
ncbi:GerAB/ArcD/ProY family transporter [Anaerosolibacter sp.]|uniref:GerAB/ArcD/ProY family transporter n=1 Tax=Anaerosolibacter sp. TaxID=1872527 RepID=UPI0039EF87A9